MNTLFATALVGFSGSIARCCMYTYAIAQHDDVFCKYCGLLNTIFSCSATMLLSVNMLLCHLSLYYPTMVNKLSKNRGIILCTTLPILINIDCYTPLLLFDAFGWDALGICTMKAFTVHNEWIMLTRIEFLCCNIVNVVLGLP
uniref:Uncharacterized protein n=1 Tax=Romanomermis culicivorax TaxID=13658 RepID=A0A915IN68_ROMCU